MVSIVIGGADNFERFDKVLRDFASGTAFGIFDYAEEKNGYVGGVSFDSGGYSGGIPMGDIRTLRQGIAVGRGKLCNGISPDEWE